MLKLKEKNNNKQIQNVGKIIKEMKIWINKKFCKFFNKFLKKEKIK